MRKNKKSIGSHALGNRTVIGIICIVAALAICFGIAPVVNKLRDGIKMPIHTQALLLMNYQRSIPTSFRHDSSMYL